MSDKKITEDAEAPANGSKETYEKPKVESVQLSKEAAEALT